MAELVPLRYGTQVGEGRSSAVSSELLVNLYLEKNPDGAKGPLSLIGTPGLKPFVTVGDGPIRGLQRLGPDLYVVSGDRCYVVNQNGDAVDLGEIKFRVGLPLDWSAETLTAIDCPPADKFIRKEYRSGWEVA